MNEENANLPRLSAVSIAFIWKPGSLCLSQQSDKAGEEETVLAAGERQGELRLADSTEIVPEENPSSVGRHWKVCGAAEVAVPRQGL